MTKGRWVALFGLGVWACGPQAPTSTPPAPPAERPIPAPRAKTEDFSGYRDRLVDTWLAKKPAMARQAGLHEHDGVIADYSPKGIEAYVAFLRQAQAKLASFEVSVLSDADALDLAILKNRIALELEELAEQDLPHTSPIFYQELYRVSRYVNFDYAPIEQRIEKLIEHQEASLKQTQHLLAAMKPRLSRPLVETSITIYKGHASYLKGDLKKLVEKELSRSELADPKLLARFSKANDALAVAATDVATRLEKEWLPRADEKSHILGKKGFARFVRAQEGRAIDLQTFEAMAEKDLARNKAAYEELAKTVKVTRPRPSELLQAATDLMNTSRKFVIDRDLISIPSEDRCKLEETPPFMRWNAAFLNMAGPFDEAKEAYYYITLPDPSWPKEEQEGYIFPHGVLSSTTIHEVYPGHFLHGLFIRQAPSRVQKLFDSYSFTEGWAHYVEEMMIEQGWAKDEPRRHLGQLSDALLRNCRFVAALGIHAKGQSLDEVAKRFQEDCFQDKATAREQAVRGTFDPGYFAYTLGKLQIMELREKLKQELGDRFELKRFHDAMMGYGAPPVALIADRVAEKVRAAP